MSSLNSEDNALPQYKYGWCLQLSGLALILAEIAALFTVSGYMARFSTVEDMVCTNTINMKKNYYLCCCIGNLKKFKLPGTCHGTRC